MVDSIVFKNLFKYRSVYQLVPIPFHQTAKYIQLYKPASSKLANMSSTTTISAIELERMSMPIEPAPSNQDTKEPQRTIRPDRSSGSASLLGENGGSEPCPTPAIAAAERWNESPQNMSRLAAAFFCFMVMGANDSAYGVSLDGSLAE